MTEKKMIKSLVNEVTAFAHWNLMNLRGQEPMDGDDVDAFTKLFKEELNKLNGNT